MAFVDTKLLCIIFQISLIKTAILNNCGSDINPSNADTVICTKQCNQCNIYCDSTDKCKNGVNIFSAALVTNIYCTDGNSCENVNFYLGNNNDYISHLPNGYSIDDFEGIYNSINIDCSGNTACKSSAIYITGNYVNGVNIDVGSNIDTFQDAQLECELNEFQSCQLKCGSSMDTCSNTRFICYGGNCNCDGNGCSSLKTGGVDVRS